MRRAGRPTPAAALVLFGSLVVAGATPFPANAETIPLTVTENSGVLRAGEPVTSGIPIAPAQTASSWALFDGATEIPLQTTVLPGRTVPWLLLDFQLSVDAGRTRTLTLQEQAATVSPPERVTIGETPSSITVTAGRLRTRLSKTDFNLLDEAWLDRNGNHAFESSEQVLSPSLTSNLTVRDAGTGSTFSGRGRPQQVTWEYRGPLRATLRVDGAYTNGANTLLDYTTRLTWFAGQTCVRVEHLIRNSYAQRERYVKLSSALLCAGATAATARIQRSGEFMWSNVLAAGAALELIPPVLEVSDTYAPYASPPVIRHNVVIDVDQNGGMIVGDLSYHGATWQLEFAENLSAGEAARRALVAADPMMALTPDDRYADLGAFGQEHFGSYSDEKNAYRRWAWMWPTPGDPWSEEHHLLRERSLYPSWSVLDATNDPESDDVWMNAVMYARAQIPTFLDRARAWSRYAKWEWAFRTDGFEYAGAWGNFMDGPGTTSRLPVIEPALTAMDAAYIDHNIKLGKAGSSHMWNGGLLDVYYLTGDRDALEAAIDVAEQEKRYFSWQNPPVQYVDGNARAYGRALLVLSRTWDATGDPQWLAAADHLITLFVQSPTYDPRGFFYAPTPPDPTRFSAEAKTVVPLMMTAVVNGLDHYYRMTGNDAVRTQLLQIAAFGRDHGLDPATGYGGDIIVVDSPNHGDVTHYSYSMYLNVPPFLPYTVASSTECFVNAMVIGYRLTGDASYLDRAKLYWNQGSKRLYTAPYGQRVATDTQVGKFVGSLQGTSPFSLLFPEGGYWDRVGLLFYEAGRQDITAPERIRDFTHGGK